ncbi:MAG TPA: calcium/sodium antiporter [Phycisphaerales bacterium]|nr:calcium/sodium antiporter [Phycisphaerales bacterium]
MALLPLLTLFVGLITLIFGSELLVRSASRLARAAGVSSFVVGLTVVAFGTSAPELGGSIRAALEGNGGLAIGNIIGSNITNICLILGFTAIVCPIPVRLRVVRAEVLQMVAATVCVMLAMIGPVVPRPVGAAFVLALLVFLVRAYVKGKRVDEQAAERRRVAEELAEEVTAGVRPPLVLNVLLIVVGIGLLVYGSSMLVSGATSLAQQLGVSDTVIGLTLVAFGTSVPELALSVVAALRREPDIAIGNILGSNVFNILCVFGFTAMVSPDPLVVPEGMWTRDLWVLLGVSLACLPIMFTGGRISRIEGMLLLGLYIGYVGALYALRGGV